ncbi:MAG TPA: hypothetical protein VHZ76_08950 [Gammaproteobacteria bacterium]|jgi:hypothetical protein|nr:hypothetical protein [Gammaproteobacteria bacterium]
MQLGIGFIGVGYAFKQQSQQFCLVDYYDNSAALLEYLETI